jgi:hypothetical protein
MAEIEADEWLVLTDFRRSAQVLEVAINETISDEETSEIWQ